MPPQEKENSRTETTKQKSVPASEQDFEQNMQSQSVEPNEPLERSESVFTETNTKRQNDTEKQRDEESIKTAQTNNDSHQSQSTTGRKESRSTQRQTPPISDGEKQPTDSRQEFDQNLTANAINDAATAQDSIGFTPYVNALSKMIVHENTQTPLVIGLYGPWGSGKTSFMKQVDSRVEDAKQLNRSGKRENRSIFFEAWQYQNAKNLSGALLFDILKELEKNNFLKSARFRFKNAFRQFNLIAGVWNLLLVISIFYFLSNTDEWMYLAGIPLIGLFINKESHEFIRGLKVPMGIDVSKLLKTNDESMQTTALHDFKPELKRVIEAFVPKGGRLILYIDDLDRCIPSQVVSILETLSVLFDSDKCIFMLGIDKPKVIRAIEAHYRIIAEQTNSALTGNEKRYGEAFLEKIIQLAIVVPVLNHSSIVEYANSLIGEQQASTTNNASSEIKEVKNKNLVLDESDIEYDANTASRLKNVIQALKPSTPRSIKRFLNRFRFIYLLWIQNRTLFPDIQPDFLPVWLLLNEMFADEISLIRRQQGASAEMSGAEILQNTPQIAQLMEMNKVDGLTDQYDEFLAASNRVKGQYLQLVQNINESYEAKSEAG
jgi:hypothetical protein